MGSVFDFEFQPHQHVMIRSYGLNVSGRVQRCILMHNVSFLYDVEYCIDGTIKRGEFLADELEAVRRPNGDAIS